MKKNISQFIVAALATTFLYPVQVISAETALYRELVRKAKEEGQVEVWTPMSKKPGSEVVAAFEKKFGIKAKFRLWRGVSTHQRTLIELKSGQEISADVMAPGRDEQQQFLDEKVFQKPRYNYLEVWPDIDNRQIDPSGWALNTTANSRAITYNPELVPPDLVPKSWDDCTRPEFKGKIVMDARHKLYALHWHKKEWFLDWIKKMRANEVKIIQGQTNVIQLVAAGAHAIHCGSQTYSTQRLIARGVQNLKIVVPGELLVESATTSFIRKGSPNPHAAQLFVGWQVSEEGQIVLDEKDYRGFPWVKGTFNAKLAEGNKVLFCGPDCAAKAGEMATEYTKALGLPVTQ